MNLRRFFILFGIFGLLFSSSVSLGWAMAQKPPAEKPAPDFPRRGIWLQTIESITTKKFKNHLTLMYFWDYTSVNCLRDLTVIKKWTAAYQSHGFQVILVHAPEFSFAADKENVARALAYYKIPYPVLLDNQFQLWEAYNNYSWPTKTLVDEKGLIVHSQAGEGKYTDMETMIRSQLESLNPGTKLPAKVFEEEFDDYDDEECGPMQAETYMGSKRAKWWGGEIANKTWIKPKSTSIFKDRGERVQRGFFLNGLWTNQEDYFEHARDTDELADYLGISYFGSSVYSVMSLPDPAIKEAKVYVTRDDQPIPLKHRGKDLEQDKEGKTYLTLKEARLYQIIVNEDDNQHEIKVWTRTKGVAVSSFSFGNRCLGTIDLFGS